MTTTQVSLNRADSVRLDRRHLCETRHGYVHVRTAGEGGVPVVLLHFTPYSGLAFRRVMPLLATDRLVLAVDRLGFGMSDGVQSDFDMSEYALATLDALDALGVQQFDVVGVHTGATEAMELATTHSERVRRVVLVGVPLFNKKEWEAFTNYIEHLFETSDDGSHLSTMWNYVQAVSEGHYTDYANPAATWTNPLAPGATGGWQPEHIQGWVLHYLLAGSERWRICKAVFDGSLWERLPTVRQPLLIFRTQDDLWLRTAQVIPMLPAQAKYIELPHLDILAFELAPEEMNTRIRAFLDDDDSNRSAR